MENTNYFKNRKEEQVGKEIELSELLDNIALTVCRKFTGRKALKGGYLLTKVLDNPRRTTDIDFSIEVKEDYSRLKEIFIEIGEELKELKYIDYYELKEEITEKMSGGVTFRNKGGKIIAGIDVGLHDLSYGTGNYSFEFLSPKGLLIERMPSEGFLVERMIADKILATLSRVRFRRTKDLYDIYCLTSNFNLDYKLLNDCLLLRNNGEVDWSMLPFSDTILVEYEKAYKTLSVNPVIGKSLPRVKPDFEKAMEIFNLLVFPFAYKVEAKLWDHKEKNWR